MSLTFVPYNADGISGTVIILIGSAVFLRLSGQDIFWHEVGKLQCCV